MDWANMKIIDVLSTHPKAASILAKYNIGCIGCFAASGETLKEGLMVHGVNVEAVIRELEETYNKK